MDSKWKFYDVGGFNDWKQKQGQSYKGPSRANFLAAANYIRKLFDGKSFNYAAIGGLAMLCLGSRREMYDMHILYEGHDFNKLQKKLEADSRIRVPQGMNSLFPAKILVVTGPQFKDKNCTGNADVEVNIIPPGYLGAPPTNILRKNHALLRLSLDGKMANFKSMNMSYLMTTTLELCKSKDLLWDPRRDIAFMCTAYGKEIESIRQQLDHDMLQNLYFSSPFFSQLPPEEQRQCSLVLLGKDLIPQPRSAPPMNQTFSKPPTEANDLKPINQELAASGKTFQSHTPRPHLASHKSTPQLKSGPQQPVPYVVPRLPYDPRLQQHNNAPKLASLQPPPTVRPPLLSVGGTAPNHDQQSRDRPRSADNPPKISSNANREPGYQTSKTIGVRPSSTGSQAMYEQHNTRLPHVRSSSAQNSLNIPAPPAFSSLAVASELPAVKGHARSASKESAPIFGPHPEYPGAPLPSQYAYYTHSTPDPAALGGQPSHHVKNFSLPSSLAAGGPRTTSLRLVGPEGLYATTPVSVQTNSVQQGGFSKFDARHSTPEPMQSQAIGSPSVAVFELADNSTSAHIPQDPPATVPSLIAPVPAQSQYRDFGVETTDITQQQNYMGLPPSLKVGGQTLHRRSLSNIGTLSDSQPQHYVAPMHRQQPEQPPKTQANPSYAAYSGHPAALPTTYRAYAAPITPPLQPYAAYAHNQHQEEFVDHPQPLNIIKTPPSTPGLPSESKAQLSASASTYTAYSGIATMKKVDGEDLLANTVTEINAQLNAQQGIGFATNQAYYAQLQQQPQSQAQYQSYQPTSSSTVPRTLSEASTISSPGFTLHHAQSQNFQQPATKPVALVMRTQDMSASHQPSVATVSGAIRREKGRSEALANEYSLYAETERMREAFDESTR